MRLRAAIVSFFLFSALTLVQAQDIHFSQFYASPLSLNPAHTGDYNGDWRFMNNYREQWKAIDNAFPYRTVSVGFDHQFFLHSEQFSWGFFVIDDRSGSAFLTVDKIFGSLAYHKTIRGNNFHIGIQPGFVIKSFQLDRLTFPDQYEQSEGYFSSDKPTNESAASSLNYFDLNVGVIWSRKFRKLRPEVGFSLFHISTPQESFLSKMNRLPLRTVANAEVTVDIGKHLYLVPKVLYMGHKKATDLLAGSNLGYKLSKNKLKMKAIFIGAYLREGFTNRDASIFLAGIHFEHLSLGFSYDNTVSEVNLLAKNADSNKIKDKVHAFEISLIFTGSSTIPNKITDPCHRY